MMEVLAVLALIAMLVYQLYDFTVAGTPVTPVDRKPVFGPLPAMRARKGYGFSRQESGQIIFRYDDDVTGRVRVRRVPKTIVSMDEAVEWIRVNHYGAQPKEEVGPSRESKRLEAMVSQVFDESTTIDEKRNAALMAMRLLRKCEATVDLAGVKVKV